MAKLVNILSDSFRKELREKSQFPFMAEYEFDISASAPAEEKNLRVRKTRRRRVVSLEFSEFRAKETIRESKAGGEKTVYRPSGLMAILPSGHNYAYDLISYVGTEALLKGRKLTDLHEEITEGKIGSGYSGVPFSSFHELQNKFLYYFGECHRQNAPLLKEYFMSRGNFTWIVDGTLEVGTPIFFGMEDAFDNIFLDGFKIPTENEKDVSVCLKKCVGLFGTPENIFMDLNEKIRAACENAVPGATNYLCQFHFAGAVGEAIYKKPQALLHKRLKELRLQRNLRTQRKKQTRDLKKSIEEEHVKLILKSLLEGEAVQTESVETFAKEVLLALHSWMLDYAKDGNRQGYPFDPFALYFHRRIEKAHEASNRLCSIGAAGKNNLNYFVYFSKQLCRYLTDKLIVEASAFYEKAFGIFENLRQVLRLISKEPNPMHGSYNLGPDELEEINNELRQLEMELEEQRKNTENTEEKNLYEIAGKYIKKYAPYLGGVTFSAGKTKFSVRTTSKLETHWNGRKKTCRRSHGTKRLTREFNALPAEYMLVPNLKNSTYIDIVLGSIDKLPEKLAEAGSKAKPYYHWKKQNKPITTGRIPNRLLRKENFIDDLVDLFDLQYSPN